MRIRTRPAASDEHARNRLAELVAERGEDYAGLSRWVIFRPAGYLGRYVRKGVPRRLPAGERRTLARYFRVAECELGAGV